MGFFRFCKSYKSFTILFSVFACYVQKEGMIFGAENDIQTKNVMIQKKKNSGKNQAL